jgi:TetR/AcrR family transcriptional regulator, regulator of biofilm formation and stress response
MRTNDRKDELVKAAMLVVSREGVARASTRRIAEAAGAPSASLHYCFGSKDELFAAVLRHAVHQIDEVLTTTTGNQVELVKVVQLVLAAFHTPMIEDKSPHCAQLDLLMWSLRSDASADVAPQTYEKYFVGLRKLFEDAAQGSGEDIDTYLLARLTAAFIDGFLLQMLFADDGYLDHLDLDAAAVALVEMVRASHSMPT